MEAIREPALAPSLKEIEVPDGSFRSSKPESLGTSKGTGRVNPSCSHPNGANKRSVWTVASSSYPGAHFATFPPKLIEPMILAGTSAHGSCVRCGAPWHRMTEAKGTVGGHQHRRKGGSSNPYALGKQTGLAAGGAGANWVTETVGWEPSCRCGSDQVRPCVVLDPFLGSGTTAAVSLSLGRRAWGIELSREYLFAHAVPRIEEAIRMRPALRREMLREEPPRTSALGKEHSAS